MRAPWRAFRAGAAATFICQSLGLGLIFLVQVLLARVLGSDTYGLFVYVTAWIGILGMVARCGLDTAVLRDSGIYAARGDWAKFRGVQRIATRWVLVMASAVGACSALVAVFLTPADDPQLRATFLVGVAMLPVSAFAAVRQSALLSLKRPWAALAPEYIARPLLLGIVVIAVSMSQMRISAPLAMAASLLAALVVAVAGKVVLEAAVPKVSPARFGLEQIQSLRSSAGTLLWFNGSGQLLYQIDTILVGVLVDPEAAGTYYAAKQIALIAGLGLVALQVTAGARIAELSSDGRIGVLQRELSAIAWRGLLFAVACAAGLLMLGNWALSLFGQEFREAFPVMMLLVAGQIVGAAGGAAGQLAAMSGLQALAGMVYVLATLLIVILSVLMVPIYGVLGAAGAVAIVTLLWITVLNVLLWRRTGVLPAVVSRWAA